MEVKQPKERLGALEAILGGFILSVLLSFFLFFFIHGWVALFFIAFFVAYLAYNLYNPKPKPGVNILMVAPKESNAPYLAVYPVDKKAKKNYMWASSEKMTFEIQTSAREDAILSNAKKKERYKIPITWVSYDNGILSKIKEITLDADSYLLIRV